jgi:serine/threonine protein kinase
MTGERIGQQVGNYRLTQVLGQGGFAEVYLGQHQRLPMQAAIKILLTHIADDNAVRRFQQEARTIATLVHPHIVRILDFDIKQGLPFLVMEYAPNGSLRHRYPKGSQLPVSTVVAYVKQIAQALQYAHGHDFIHRDIKPENMLLDATGRLVLSDFGIATIVQHTSSFDHQTIAGTTPYMAPEQLQGKPCAASDQYALGITVYEWLTGSQPFKGSPTEVAMQHLLTSPPPLRHYNATLLPAIEKVVLTALEKDAAHRFPHVEAFAHALEATLHSSQLAETFPSASEQRFSSPFGTPPPLFSGFSPFSAPTRVYEVPDPGFDSSSFSPPFSADKAEQSPFGDERTDYEALVHQIETNMSPLGGALIVRAPGCPDGTVVKLVEQSFWNLSPQLMESFPRTRYAEIRRYPIEQGHSVSAAVFSDLLPTQYVIWTAQQQKTTAIAYGREARIITL